VDWLILLSEAHLRQTLLPRNPLDAVTIFLRELPLERAHRILVVQPVSIALA
jgi:hypothetical protein